MDEVGGGEKNKAEYPMGFRFKPKDEELVRYYLLPRLQGRPTVPNDSIIEANVYESHPETLTNAHKSGTEQEEWYFLSARSRMYGNGVRPARKTRDGRGRWKASTATKEVAEQVVCNGGVTFCRNVLNYFVGKPKNETRTKWIMLEITVPQYEIKLDNPGPKNMLDEYVMCKIYVSPQHKKKADDDDEQDPAGEPNLLEKQSGKRPMLVPQRGLGPPARKQARVGSLGIGSTSTQAMGCSTSNAASSPSQVYFGLPGQQPTGAHYGLLQAPPMLQRPAGAYSVGQAPARPPAGAFSGQRLVQMPAPTPVTYQPFGNPIDEDPFGQAMATMAPRPNPANQAAGRMLQCFPGNPPRRHPGTAFRPQVSLQCFYDHQNYRGGQPLGNASQAAFLPQQQQPLFNRRGGASTAAAAAPPGPAYNGYPCQRSSMTPAAGDHGGAANGGNGAARFNVNAEQHFVDLATMRPPSLDGWCMPPAAGHLVEPAAPAAAGATKAEPETGEPSGLNTQDAA